MQRWMFYAGLGLFSLILLAGVGYFGLKEYRLRKPAPRWVSLYLKYDLPAEQQKELAAQIQKKLGDDDVLRQIVIDAKLKKGFQVVSDEAALAELKSRMFVELGMYDSPNGRVPSINIGVKGIAREKGALDAASVGMMRAVSIMMGIDPATGKQIQSDSPAVPVTEF